MRVADGWKDYELLDCSDGERLERWGDIILIRPDPQIIWSTKKKKLLLILAGVMIAVMAAAYPIHKRTLRKEREAAAPQILALSQDIKNEL